jgi:hypothetical protein
MQPIGCISVPRHEVANDGDVQRFGVKLKGPFEVGRTVRGPDGTRLTIVESGFDQLSPDRRAQAILSNSQGWTSQMQNIRRHVEG